MSELADIPSYSQRFAESGEYEKYFTNKYPGHELAILSYIDVCIIELLPNTLGLKNGDAKPIRNAGASVTHPWGSVVRSLLAAVFELKIKKIMAIAHHDCGMRGLHAGEFLQRVHDDNTPGDRIEALRNAGIGLNGWPTSFDDVEDNVRHIVKLVRGHPLVPDNIVIHGLVIHPAVGKLNLTVDGSLPALDGQNIQRRHHREVKDIGLFGGIFDPIRNSHSRIARAFAGEISLDLVIFLPIGDPYHKGNTRVPAQECLNMAGLTIADESRFVASDCNITRDGATYTSDTVQVFRQQFPGAQLWQPIDSDNLMQLHTWKKWQTPVHQAHIIIAMRQSDNLNKTPRELHTQLDEALQNGSVHILNTPLYSTSSTQIRVSLAKMHHSDGLPQPVTQYIRQRKLYEK